VCDEPLTPAEHLVLHLIHLDPRLSLHRQRPRLRLVARTINHWLSVEEVGRALMKLREHHGRGRLHTWGLEPIAWDQWTPPTEAQAAPVIHALFEHAGWHVAPSTVRQARESHVVRLVATR
jgi:hypothetical protein